MQGVVGEGSPISSPEQGGALLMGSPADAAPTPTHSPYPGLRSCLETQWIQPGVPVCAPTVATLPKEPVFPGLLIF